MDQRSYADTSMDMDVSETVYSVFTSVILRICALCGVLGAPA